MSQPYSWPCRMKHASTWTSLCLILILTWHWGAMNYFTTHSWEWLTTLTQGWIVGPSPFEQVRLLLWWMLLLASSGAEFTKWAGTVKMCSRISFETALWKDPFLSLRPPIRAMAVNSPFAVNIYCHPTERWSTFLNTNLTSIHEAIVLCFFATMHATGVVTLPARWTGWRKPPPKSMTLSFVLQQARMRSTFYTILPYINQWVFRPTYDWSSMLCLIMEYWRWGCCSTLHITYVCYLYVRRLT